MRTRVQRPAHVPRARLPAVHDRLRQARRRRRHARPDARGRGRRHDRRPLPQRRRAPQPGGDDAPARRQVHARSTTARTSALFTLAGGFVAPGEEFTYTWECTPDSVGVWPYHDHGPNHTLNTLRGLFGTLIVREKGAPRPDVEVVQFMHSFPPNVTRLRAPVPRDQRPVVRGQHADRPRARRPGRRLARDGRRRQLPHLPRARPPLARRRTARFTDNPSFGPNETITARWREDNPGRWLYHCHVFSAPGRRHGRLVPRRVRDSHHPEERRGPMRIARRPLTAAAVGIAAALVVPGHWPGRRLPARRATRARARRTAQAGGTLKVCKKGCQFKKIQKAIDAAGKGTTIRVGEGTYKEGLKILSPRKDRVRLIGDPKNPRRVILEGKRPARQRRPERRADQQRRPRAGQRLHRPQLQGQRLLRRQRRRLQADQPGRRERPASTASTRSTPRAARCRTRRPSTTTTRASTSARRRRRPGRSAPR